MLSIAPDKDRFQIIKAREFDAKVEPEVPDPGDNPTDDDNREILFDYPDHPTVEEIRGFLEGLALNGKTVCVYSAEGLNDTAHTSGCCCCGGNEILNSLEVNVNIFAYALLH